MMKIKLVFLVALFSTLLANDFPTKDRVEFVYECMGLKGGVNYVNLTACSCALDKVASKMTYDEFVSNDSITRLKNMMGERGGLFRASDEMRKQRRAFLKVKKTAMKACFSTVVVIN